MADVTLENPILNSPFEAPTRHWRFGESGITGEIEEGRRVSSYFVPIPASRQRAQLEIETEWTRDRIKENESIQRIRARVGMWRSDGWRGVTPTTRRLLEHWTDPERDRKLFFCQVEALETAIYLAECARQFGDDVLNAELRRFADDQNPDLFRVAFKMATGSGKTVVMAMLIAWQTLNKQANRRDGRFSDRFLIVAPGITIRDRLRVLLPGDEGNYYRERDIVPPGEEPALGDARIVITNFHAFKRREAQVASSMTKAILTRGGPNPFEETPDQMVNRVCRELGAGRSSAGIVVLNDEAHHCYAGREGGEPADAKGDDLREARERDEHARVWLTGLQAVARKIGVKVVYDLSATPFFLRGSGWPEGTLFQWVVSDFSLIDAIESGIVKIPRVPVADNAMDGDGPTYRSIWPRIREGLPKRASSLEPGASPKLPVALEGALQSLYANYEKAFERWRKAEEQTPRASTPPVFIIVCNNTTVSKLVYDYVAGYERIGADGVTSAPVAGELRLFSNVERDGFIDRPRTILVDSAQLESGEGMKDEFKRVASREIEEFKREYRARFPGRDADDLRDEDLLREVMNTVGKRGRLGEGVRCVVSVSMLTEGWDANTVTHILGVRAFGTQLLCEQVVGRGLRRVSYEVGEDGLFSPEYAEVYGVPFSFLPASGSTADPPPAPLLTRVRALPERAVCEIAFPRIVGYRHELTGERLTWSFGEAQRMSLTTRDVPTETDVRGIVGAAEIHTLDELRSQREQHVAFTLARRLVARQFEGQPWLFPQILAATKEWMRECVDLGDFAFIQLLLFAENADAAVERIYQGIVSSRGEGRVVAVPAPYDPIGSSASVDFTTRKDTFLTSSDKCHVEYATMDSGWEAKLADTLERMPEVGAYVKNDRLGFKIPYTLDGQEHGYLPDFIVRIDDGHGDDLLNLVIEVTGERRVEKVEKVNAAMTLWIPGVNHLREFGRWDLIEITDPWNAAGAIRAHLATQAVVA